MLLHVTFSCGYVCRVLAFVFGVKEYAMGALRLFGMISAICLVAGCATLNEAECRNVDWSDLGFSDGVRGFNQNRIEQHQRACARHDLPVNPRAYLAGWTKGIPRFCTMQNGYEHGRAGKRYANSCPAALAGPFEAAYRPAKRLADAEEDVIQLKDEIDRLRDDRDALVKSEDKGAEERAEDLRKDIRRARRDLRRAEREERRAREALFLFLRDNPGIKAVPR